MKKLLLLSLLLFPTLAQAQSIGISGAGSGAPADAHYYTNQVESGLSAEVVPTANVITLLGSADNAAMRTNLGLGALATVTPGTGVATTLAVNVGSAGAPIVLNGALGTPSSGTGTNLTGIPIATGIAGTSADLKTALTNELDPSTSGLAIFSPGGLNVTTGKTLTATQSITLTGTDSTVMTFPTTSATVARTDAAQTFTGHNTFEGVTPTGATGTGLMMFSISPSATGTLGAAAIVATGNIAAGGASQVGFTGRSIIKSSVDGKLNLTNNAGTGVLSSLTFGPESTGFAQIAASATALTVKLGDGTAGGTLAVPNNPMFLVTRITSAQTTTDNTFTVIDWNSESQDVGAKFDSTTNDEWCPAWTGGIALTFVVQSFGGTYVAATGFEQLRILKGTTGAETAFADGPSESPVTTSFAGGLTMSIFDIAASTDCYRFAAIADVSAGSPTVPIGIFASGRAF